MWLLNTASPLWRFHIVTSPFKNGRLLLLFKGPRFTFRINMNLSDKIWVTRKTRIFTEKRLIKNSLLSELFIIVFSLLMVFFSIWNYIHPNQNINFLLICGAIALLTVSIFLSSQKFTERAHAMRNCYISLDELYFKVKKHERGPDPDVIDDYQKRYNITFG